MFHVLQEISDFAGGAGATPLKVDVQESRPVVLGSHLHSARKVHSTSARNEFQTYSYARFPCGSRPYLFSLRLEFPGSSRESTRKHRARPTHDCPPSTGRFSIVYSLKLCFRSRYLLGEQEEQGRAAPLSRWEACWDAIKVFGPRECLPKLESTSKFLSSGTLTPWDEQKHRAGTRQLFHSSKRTRSKLSLFDMFGFEAPGLPVFFPKWLEFFAERFKWSHRCVPQMGLVVRLRLRGEWVHGQSYLGYHRKVTKRMTGVAEAGGYALTQSIPNLCAGSVLALQGGIEDLLLDCAGTPILS